MNLQDSLPKENNGSENIDTATLELLAKWLEEDKTDDPEKIRAAEIELAEFKKNMNLNRVVFPEALLDK